MGKKNGVPELVGDLEPYFNWQTLSRQIRHLFNARVGERTLMTPLIMRSKDAQCKCEELL